MPKNDDNFFLDDSDSVSSMEERHVEALKWVMGNPYLGPRREALLESIADLGSPLVTLSSLGVLIRSRLNYLGSDKEHIGNLFYASPISHHVGRCGEYNKFMPDRSALETCWCEIEDAVDLLITARRRGMPGIEILEADGELSAAFWTFVTSDPELQMVVRDAYLAAIGEAMWLVDFETLDAMRILASDYGSYDSILFLMERLNSVH